MAKLGETIVSPALSGKPLEVGAKAFEQPKQAGDVAELRAQVELLTKLLAGQAQAAPAVEVVEAPNKKSTTKAAE